MSPDPSDFPSQGPGEDAHPEPTHPAASASDDIPGPRELAFTELMWATFEAPTATRATDRPEPGAPAPAENSDLDQGYDEPAAQASAAADLWSLLCRRQAQSPDDLHAAFMRTVATMTHGPITPTAESFPSGWVKHTAANSLTHHLRRALYLLPSPRSHQLRAELEPYEATAMHRTALTRGLTSPLDIVATLRIDNLAVVYAHLDHFAGWCRTTDLAHILDTQPSWLTRAQHEAALSNQARAAQHQQRRDFHALAAAVNDAMRHLHIDEDNP